VKLNSGMYTLQTVVRGKLSVSSLTLTRMSTQYEMSGSTAAMSKVGGASQVRRITFSMARFLLVRLLRAAGVPTKDVVGYAVSALQQFYNLAQDQNWHSCK